MDNREDKFLQEALAQMAKGLIKIETVADLQYRYRLAVSVKILSVLLLAVAKALSYRLGLAP